MAAALGHVVALFLAARVAPRALDPPLSSDSAWVAELVAVEMWVDSPVPISERERPTREEGVREAAPAPHAMENRAARERFQGAGAGSARDKTEGGEKDSTFVPGEDFSPVEEPPWSPRLRLSDVVDLAPEGPPAPTRPPPPQRVVTADDTNEAVRSIVRDADKTLGLGNPQETAIAAAVQEAGRASGVPSGTRFVVTVQLDRNGNVTDASIRGDTAGDGAWSATLAAIRGKLGKPVPLGPDDRARGARVTVEATLLHVYPSGSDKSVVMGSCPQMPLIGGEQAPHFMNIGGEQYLEPPNGLCALSDGDFKDSLKTIVVRTKARTHHEREAPPALSSFPPRPKPKKLLPTPLELVMRAINGK